MIFLCHRSPSQVPRLVLPDDIFVSIGRSIGAEVNRALLFLQDLSCGGNLKQFLAVGLNCGCFLIFFHSVHSANQTTVLYSATIWILVAHIVRIFTTNPCITNIRRWILFTIRAFLFHRKLFGMPINNKEMCPNSYETLEWLNSFSAITLWISSSKRTSSGSLYAVKWMVAKNWYFILFIWKLNQAAFLEKFGNILTVNVLASNKTYNISRQMVIWVRKHAVWFQCFLKSKQSVMLIIIWNVLWTLSIIPELFRL